MSHALSGMGYDATKRAATILDWRPTPRLLRPVVGLLAWAQLGFWHQNPVEGFEILAHQALSYTR